MCCGNGAQRAARRQLRWRRSCQETHKKRPRVERAYFCGSRERAEVVTAPSRRRSQSRSSLRHERSREASVPAAFAGGADEGVWHLTGVFKAGTSSPAQSPPRPADRPERWGEPGLGAPPPIGRCATSATSIWRQASRTPSVSGLRGSRVYWAWLAASGMSSRPSSSAAFRICATLRLRIPTAQIVPALSALACAPIQAPTVSGE